MRATRSYAKERPPLLPSHIARSFQNQRTSSIFFSDLFCFNAFSARDTKLCKGKAAIVTNCPTLLDHFKVNALGQIFFDLFRFHAFSALYTKLRKGKAAIFTNFPTLRNHFKVNALRQFFFPIFICFHSFSARHEVMQRKGRHCN